jgi:hypothetical protein
MAETENAAKIEAAHAAALEHLLTQEEPTKVAEETKASLTALLELVSKQTELIAELSKKIDELSEQLSAMSLRSGPKSPVNSPLTSIDDGKLRIVEDYGKGTILLHGKKASMAFKDSIFKPNGFTYTDRSDYGPAWVGSAKKLPELMKLLDKANAGRRSKIEVKKTDRAAMDKLAEKAAALDDEDEEEVKPTKTVKNSAASKKVKEESSDDEDGSPKMSYDKKTHKAVSDSDDEKEPVAKPKSSKAAEPAKPKPAMRKLAAKSSAKKADSDDSDEEEIKPSVKKSAAKPKPGSSKKASAKSKGSDSDKTDNSD